jgi:uncharacterized membrane protein YhiD involved in acid resistance
VTAALGIACGLGAWRTVVIAMILTFVLLLGVRWVERLVLPDEP